MKFHFIYLAAGYSRRYGTNKLLALYKGTPMYRVLLDRLVNILTYDESVIDITVVTQYKEIQDEVGRINRESGLPVKCVINPDPSRGISSSIKCAVSQIIEDNEALIFFVADTPRLTEETVNDFIHAFAQSGKRLACIGRDGEMGNPGGFGAEFIPELMELEGDRGGKRILLAHRDDVFIFSDTKTGELEDIDYSC